MLNLFYDQSSIIFDDLLHSGIKVLGEGCVSNKKTASKFQKVCRTFFFSLCVEICWAEPCVKLGKHILAVDSEPLSIMSLFLKVHSDEVLMETCEGEQLTPACPYLKADQAHFLHFTLDTWLHASIRQRD